MLGSSTTKAFFILRYLRGRLFAPSYICKWCKCITHHNHIWGVKMMCKGGQLHFKHLHTGRGVKVSHLSGWNLEEDHRSQFHTPSSFIFFNSHWPQILIQTIHIFNGPLSPIMFSKKQLQNPHFLPLVVLSRIKHQGKWWGRAPSAGDFFFFVLEHHLRTKLSLLSLLP